MIVANIAMHYGSDYVAYAIKPIYDHVDKIVVAYAEKPSHGHSSNLVNPDTRSLCYDAVYQSGDPKNKIRWIDGVWRQECDQRNIIFDLYPNADMICLVDADEIWHSHEFAATLEWCLRSPVKACKQSLRTPWRSFNWICDDQMIPDRWFKPKLSEYTTVNVPQEIGVYYHMGYARELKHIKYKLSCHGHTDEIFKGWFENKYSSWSPTNNIPDLHPTCSGFWYASPFDKYLLPVVLRDHPYWNKSLIE